MSLRRWKAPGAQRGARAKLLEIASGFYTPTLTNVANISSSTAAVLRVLRVGDVVLVSGKVTVDPAAAGVLTRLGISLPVASEFTDAGDCAGVAMVTAILGDTAGIIADATNNRAEISWVATQPESQAMSLLFQYVVQS